MPVANSQTAQQILDSGKSPYSSMALTSVQKSSLQKQAAAQAPKVTAKPTAVSTVKTPPVQATTQKPVAQTPAVQPQIQNPTQNPATAATPTSVNPMVQQGVQQTGDPNFQKYGNEWDQYQNASPEEKKAMEAKNPLLANKEYQTQQSLNQPVMDYFDNQKYLEGSKLVQMQGLLDQQKQEDSFMVSDQLKSIKDSAGDNLDLLKQQKDAELAVLDQERASRSSNALQAKDDAQMEMDRNIRDQQEQVVDKEAQARTSLGLTGGFGSQARLDTISKEMTKGNELVTKLQIAKTRLSTDFAKTVDGIEKDYSDGSRQVLFNYDKNMISLKKDATDQILSIKKQALLTKQQKDEKYAAVKQNFFDKLGEIEKGTATLIAQTNKDTYKSIMDAQQAELDRQQKKEEQVWTRAKDLIQTYGGENGAIMAEKMLGLPQGSLPRAQTVEEAKMNLDYMKYQSDNVYKMAGLQMDQRRQTLSENEFGWKTGEYDPSKVVMGTKPLDMAWDQVPAEVKGNCVAFCRSVVPDLPYGLGADPHSKEQNAKSKRSAINSQEPKPGSIAVMPTRGLYGHVAYVESVNDDGTLTIVDANDPGSSGLVGGIQTLSAGGKGVGGSPGLRRKIIDPKKAGVEGYFVGRGSLTVPMDYKQVNLADDERLNSQNDTGKWDTEQTTNTALFNHINSQTNLPPQLQDALKNAFGIQPDLNAAINLPNTSASKMKEAELAAIKAGAIKPDDLNSDYYRRTKNSDPQGYIAQLQAAAGSKSGDKPLNIQQSQAAGYAVSASQSEGVLNKIAATNPNLGELNDFITRSQKSDVAYDVINKIKSTPAKQLAQAELTWVESVLRPASGAAISMAEYGAYGNMYFPRPGDDATVLAQKKAAREQRVKNLLFESGSQGQDYYNQQLYSIPDEMGQQQSSNQVNTYASKL